MAWLKGAFAFKRFPLIISTTKDNISAWVSGRNMAFGFSKLVEQAMRWHENLYGAQGNLH